MVSFEPPSLLLLSVRVVCVCHGLLTTSAEDGGGGDDFDGGDMDF